jgi:hypothetical protein
MIEKTEARSETRISRIDTKKKRKDVRHRSILMRRQEARKETLTAKPLRAQREIYD